MSRTGLRWSAAEPQHAHGAARAPGARTGAHTPQVQTLLHLQRTAGNRAVAGALAGSSPLPVLQRYTTASLTAEKIDWLGETVKVTRPPEGASGGVYFMKSAEGELVAKPEGLGEGTQGVSEGELAQEARTLKARAGFATTFLSKAMKIRTPEMRFVDKKSDASEFDALKIAIRARLAVKPGQNKPDYSFSDVHHFAVMGKASGGTLSGMSKKAGEQSMAKQDTGEVLELVKKISNDAFVMRVGQLVVADALMNNADRLNVAKANIGNIMMDAKGGLTAIDQHAQFKFRPGSQKMMLDIDLQLITDLFTRRREIFNSYIEGIKGSLEKGGVDESGFDYWVGPQELTRMWKAFDVGVKIGIKDAADALRDPGVEAELRAQAQKHPSAMVDWNGFQVRQRYFLALAQGSEPAEALSLAAALANQLQPKAPPPPVGGAAQPPAQVAPKRGLAARILGKIRG